MNELQQQRKPINVWVLADNRPGNVNQCLGVAEALGFPYIIKNIVYNAYVMLPNLVRGASLLGVDVQHSDSLSKELPDLVIAAGRRLAPVAQYIKRKSGNRTKLVQLMDPGAPRGGFDLIVVPRHDNASFSQSSMEILGAPNAVSPKDLEIPKKEWESEFAPLPSLRVGVLIGGNASGKPFSQADAKHLSNKVQELLLEHGGGSLLVSTSRRTSDEATSYLQNAFTFPHYFYAWEPEGKNPYKGILAHSDILVVTGDSISMCSECCSTGKPVYIVADRSSVPAKHYRFIESLFEAGCAKLLENSLESWSYTPLNEAQKIADRIRTFVLAQ